MDAGGSNVRRLTDDPALDGPVAWSPDGRQLLFSSSRGSRPGTYHDNLYLMNVDGSDVRPLALGPDLTGWASWSPDGKRILFASSRSGNSDIYVADADGSNLHDLTNGHASNSNPNWSPDGKKIVFESDRAYSPEIGPNRDGSPEQGCALRQYQPTPGERVPLRLDLPPGRYILIVSAGFIKGQTEQGFSVMVQ
jgi:Tol biopolymer transport system component